MFEYLSTMEMDMFKIYMIACVLMPFPRGEILNTKCYTDKWQPSVHGYPSKKQCLKRINVIRDSIKKNFDLYYVRKSYCKKSISIS